MTLVSDSVENRKGIFRILNRAFDIKLYKFHIRYEPSSLLAYIFESAVLNTFCWIPGFLGALLRNLFYRLIFAKIGNFVFLAPSVDIKSAGSIELGNRVVMQSNVHINGWHLGSKLRLKNFAYLDRGVNIMVHDNAEIEIGERTYIGPYTCMAGPGPVKIGDNCLISSHCGIYGNNHVFENPAELIKKQGFTNKGITIGNDCWLGTGVKVLDGVSLGEGSVIGAGAVVTKDIPAYSVAVGVPAKIVSRRQTSST